MVSPGVYSRGGKTYFQSATGKKTYYGDSGKSSSSGGSGTPVPPKSIGDYRMVGTSSAGTPIYENVITGKQIATKDYSTLQSQSSGQAAVNPTKEEKAIIRLRNLTPGTPAYESQLRDIASMRGQRYSEFVKEVGYDTTPKPSTPKSARDTYDRRTLTVGGESITVERMRGESQQQFESRVRKTEQLGEARLAKLESKQAVAKAKTAVYSQIGEQRSRQTGIGRVAGTVGVSGLMITPQETMREPATQKAVAQTAVALNTRGLEQDVVLRAETELERERQVLQEKVDTGQLPLDTARAQLAVRARQIESEAREEFSTEVKRRQEVIGTTVEIRSKNVQAQRQRRVVQSDIDARAREQQKAIQAVKIGTIVSERRLPTPRQYVIASDSAKVKGTPLQKFVAFREKTLYGALAIGEASAIGIVKHPVKVAIGGAAGLALTLLPEPVSTGIGTGLLVGSAGVIGAELGFSPKGQRLQKATEIAYSDAPFIFGASAGAVAGKDIGRGIRFFRETPFPQAKRIISVKAKRMLGVDVFKPQAFEVDTGYVFEGTPKLTTRARTDVIEITPRGAQIELIPEVKQPGFVVPVRGRTPTGRPIDVDISPFKGVKGVERQTQLFPKEYDPLASRPSVIEVRTPEFFEIAARDPFQRKFGIDIFGEQKGVRGLLQESKVGRPTLQTRFKPTEFTEEPFEFFGERVPRRLRILPKGKRGQLLEPELINPFETARVRRFAEVSVRAKDSLTDSLQRIGERYKSGSRLAVVPFLASAKQGSVVSLAPKYEFDISANLKQLAMPKLTSVPVIGVGIDVGTTQLPALATQQASLPGFPSLPFMGLPGVPRPGFPTFRPPNVSGQGIPTGMFFDAPIYPKGGRRGYKPGSYGYVKRGYVPDIAALIYGQKGSRNKDIFTGVERRFLPVNEGGSKTMGGTTVLQALNKMAFSKKRVKRNTKSRKSKKKPAKKKSGKITTVFDRYNI